MAFWGTEVKPGKPVTHSCEKARGRLRISQATLGLGEATKKTVVQCNVGERAPVLLCALLPNKTESCHLDLEFEEADDVVFSVIGPRSVYLTGYFVRQIPRVNSHSDTESYGVDIENSHTKGSSYCSDDEKYDDSFINDDELQVSPLPPEYVRNEDDVSLENDKAEEGKGHGKQHKNKFIVVESDDDLDSCENEAEDGHKSSVSKDKRNANTSFSDEEVADITETGDNAKDTDDSGAPMQKVDPLDINTDLGRSINLQLDEERASGENKTNDLPNPKETQIIENIITSNDNASTDDMELRNNVKDSVIDLNVSQKDMKDGMQSHDLGRPKKKRKKRSTKEDKTIEFQTDIKDHNLVNKDKDHGVEASAAMETDMNCAVTLMEMSNSNGKEMKRKKTEHPDEPQTGIVEECRDLYTESVAKNFPHSDGDAKDSPTANGEYQEQVSKGTSMEGINATLDSTPREEEIVSNVMHHGSTTMELPAANGECEEQQIDNISSELLAKDSQHEKKSKRNKKKKRRGKQDLNMVLSETTNNEEAKLVEDEIEDKNATPIQRKTLSNGLIIEELASGPPDGKVAKPGNKVKIFYTGMLKDDGFVFDSNVGKAPFKFQLGDEEYIDGWNVGIDGMRVGDKRRLIIPPSMGFGEHGVGDNIPPNSWLVYEMELAGVRG